MKKTLLLLMLLPFIGFTQNPSELLVRWEGTRINWSAPSPNPMYYYGNPAGTLSVPAAITASNISGNNINYAENNSNNYQGYTGTNWPTAASIDYTKYIQITITPGTGKKIEIKNILFQQSGYCASYQVIAQKTSSVPTDSSFSEGTVLTTVTNASSTQNTNILLTLASGYYVNPGETLYIRFYGYQRDPNNQPWRLNHSGQLNNVGNPTSTGPAIYGLVSDAGGVTAVNDSASTTETQSVNINVLANDLTTGTSVGSVSIATPSANGIAAVQPDNTITFTPTGNYFGTTSFQYLLTGADNSTSTGTVTVTVNPFASPVVANESFTTGEGIAKILNVLANDTAGSGTISAVSVVTPPANGSYAINPDKTITYTPNPGFTGTNTIVYTVTNSNNKTSGNATATITVEAIVSATANNDTASTAINTPLNLNVLSNDVAGNSPINTVVVTVNPVNGTAIVNADKTITYTPANNYLGEDSFTYSITDGYNATDTATVTINVLQPTTSGPLCGTYYIGPGGDFFTITEAVNHLNAHGVECPVTFLLTKSTYASGNGAGAETFPIKINEFTGSSAVNTVTFKPAPSVNAVIQVDDITVNGAAYQAISAFWLNGADNIIFDGSNTPGGTTRNLTVYNNNSIDYVQRTVFWVASNGSNGATNITIKHTNIRQGYKNQGGNFCIGIYSGNNSMEGDNPNSRTLVVLPATANNSNLTIWNNDFMNVKQGVYINGGTTATTNLIVHQNDLGAENNTETIIQPACLHNVNTFEFTENLVYRLYRDTANGSLVSSALYVTGNSSNGIIRRNNISDLTKTLDEGIYFAGIVLQSTNLASNILVANNFILNVASINTGNYRGNGHGIIIAGGGGYKIYYNTIALNKNQEGTSNGFTAALYVENGTALDVRNNIFVNNQTTTNTRRSGIAVKYNYANVNTVFTHLDYNNIYSNDAVGFIANAWPINDIESFNSPDYLTTLGAWQSITGKDTHSLNVNPVFASTTDLHLANNNSALDNAGTPIAAVPKDIDGQLRNSSTPDVGADEFGAFEIVDPGTGNGIYCESSTTWDGEEWSDGVPTSETDVIFVGDYTQNGGTLNACSIFVEGSARVLFTNQSNAVVVHNVNVAEEAALTFESGSNLIQTEETQNNGIVTVKRNSSKLKRLDYTIWSSPVHGDQTLLEFSPQTLTNRFYILNTTTNQYNVVPDPAETTFTTAKGYLIRVPNNFPESVPTVFEGIFEGTPNNGDIYIPLVFANAGYNAVGNPYPSPISVTNFIDANIDNIQGTLWLWRKTNDPTKTSYSTVTKIGYTANAAPGGTNELVADPFEIDINGVLNTGQGFLVKAKNSQNVVFRNNMRKGNNFANFFKMSGGSNTNAGQSVGLQASRIWINVINSEDAFTQTLIGYTGIASTGYDNGLDGKTFGDGDISVYSVINDSEGEILELAIQARPEFNVNDVVPLGFKAENAGTFEFTIDHVNGIFEGDQNIYIKDKLNDVVHNLKESNYSFTTEAGTFNERFEVVYTTDALNVTAPEVAAKDVVIYRQGNILNINSPKEIQSVTIYDMLGRALYNSNTVNSTEFSTVLSTAQQVVIVRVTLENQQVISKKIMMN